MAFGQLHSTGTLCTARQKCPLESEGGHFDSIQELVDHTAGETGVDKRELNSILDTGVTPRELVAMAREGILDGTVPVSERQTAPAPRELKHPAKLTIDLDAGRGTPDIEKSFMEEMEAQGFPVAELEDFGDGKFAFTVEAAGDPESYSVVMAGSIAALNAHRRAGMPEEDLEEYGEWMDIHAEMEKAVSDGEDS